MGFLGATNQIDACFLGRPKNRTLDRLSQMRSPSCSEIVRSCHRCPRHWGNILLGRPVASVALASLALPTASRVNWSQMQLNLQWGVVHQTRAADKNKVRTLLLGHSFGGVARWSACPAAFNHTLARMVCLNQRSQENSWLLRPLQVDFGQVLGRPLRPRRQLGLVDDARLLSDERIELCSSRLGMKPTAGQSWTSGSLRPWSYILRSESSVQIFFTKC